MQIKFKKISFDASAPKRGTSGSAGFDFTATTIEVLPGQHLRFGTGIAIEIPPGHVGLLFPRSSCYKNGMMLSNCVGVLDSDYRGEIKFVFRQTVYDQQYQIGDRIGQIVVVPIPEISYIEVAELSMTERGEGGYGSTGK